MLDDEDDRQFREMVSWRREVLTRQEDAYLTFHHMRECGTLKREIERLEAKVRPVHRQLLRLAYGKPPRIEHREQPKAVPERPPYKTTWRDRFPALQVPSFVPDYVQFLACDYWAQLWRFPGEIELIHRLLTDPRMEAVWREILRKRQTGEYQYLSDRMKKGLGTVRANEVFPASTAIVFRDAVFIGFAAAEIRRQKSTEYCRQAYAVGRDADFLRRMLAEHRLGKHSSEVSDLAHDLDKAANTYTRLSELAGFGDAGSRLFDGSRLAAKGFAREMAKTMRGCYGNPLYGTITTLAKVALDDDKITVAAVRPWCAP